MDSFKHARKLIQWTEENWEEWQTVCNTMQKPIDYCEFLRLMAVLVKNEFYESLLVLFTCHHDSIAPYLPQLLHELNEARESQTQDDKE